LIRKAVLLYLQFFNGGLKFAHFIFMTKLSVKLSKYLSIWMIFFLLFKVVFLSWNYDQSILLSGGKIVGIFWYALKMNVTTACYLLLLTVLSIGLRFFLKAVFINIFASIYSLIVIILASLLTMPNHGLYVYFGTRVNKTAFNYFNYPFSIGASESYVYAFPPKHICKCCTMIS